MTIATTLPARDEARGSARVTGIAEGILLGSAAVAQLALRLYYVSHQQLDSDEPQHLHVVWGWTQGLVQYRDLFDNHAPLFHLLMAPAVAAFGEHPEIIVFARWLMLPLVAATLWATYFLGRSLWSERAGRWAAALAGLVPTFLLTSTEFRADDLWMVGWLFSLAVLLGGELTRRRALLSGLLLGATLATSLKTVLLILALALAAGLALWIGRRGRREFAPKSGWRIVGWIAAGVAVVPALVMLAFWRLHALGALFQCAVWHNLVPGLGLWRSATYRPMIFPLALVILYLTARRLLSSGSSAGPRLRQVVFLLTAGFSFALLESYWPLITKEDALPLLPMGTLLGVAAVQWGLARAANSQLRLMPIGAETAVLALAVALGVAATVRLESDPDDSRPRETQLLADVVRFTRPGEPIMDLKGETIFRPRSHFYALEGVTKARLAMGLLPDRIAPDIVRTRTHFAVRDNSHFPPAARRFLNEHFVPAGELRVLGKDLGSSAGESGAERAFDVSYPERFVVLADGAAARGALDGLPYRGPMLLQPGSHRYRPRPWENHVGVLWEGALERRFVPSSFMAVTR